MNYLLAHGSSAAIHAGQVQALAAGVSDMLGETVGVSFLTDNALPKGATVLPLFLGEGKHVSEDIPKLAAASGCTLLPPLAAHADAIAEMAVDQLTKETRRINAIFVLYQFAGFERLAAALYARAKICSKHALTSLHSEPSLASVLQHWQSEGMQGISLQPMLLFEGQSMDRLRGMMADSNIQITNGPFLSDLAEFPALIAGCLKS